MNKDLDGFGFGDCVYDSYKGMVIVGVGGGWKKHRVDESQGRWLKEGTIFMYCIMDVFV